MNKVSQKTQSRKLGTKQRGAKERRNGQDVNRRNFLRLESLEPRLALATMTAMNDAFHTGVDQPLNTSAPGVLANDIGSGPMSAALFTGPAHGTLTFNTDGSFVYTPESGFNGQDSFVYSANDGVSNSLLAAVTIDVSEGTAPISNADSYSLSEDETLLMPGAAGVLANDESAASATVELISGPASGELTLQPDGGFIYVPEADYTGEVSFTYRATNSIGVGNEATVTLSIAAVNDLPVAINDAFTVDEDQTLTTSVSVIANDTDIEGSSLIPQLASQPMHGTVTFNADGTFTYQAEANFNGIDGFSYLVNDGTDDSEVATVTISVNPVNDAPVAGNDEYWMDEDATLTVDPAGILANDSDIDLDSLMPVIVAQPLHGAVTLNADGSFAYTPEANFSGVDGFSYQASDGSATSDVASVTINIAPINDPPTAVNDEYTITEDTELTVEIPGVLLNDLDPDSDALTTTMISQPQHGTVTFGSDGKLVYMPAADFNGVDGFSYTVSDGVDTSAVASVTITVTPVNDAPVSVADAYDVAEDNVLIIEAPGILGNDTDIDSSSLTAAIGTGPANGSVEIAADGSFVYTPNADFNGEDSFTYTASDGEIAGAEMTVTITVNPENDKPIAEDDAWSTDENVSLQIAAAGVLANDSDIDGDALSASVVTGPTNGTLALAADGSFLYTPNAGFAGTDTFTYAAGDGTEAATAVVTITVNDVVQPPITNGDAYNVAEDMALDISAAWGVLANDFDPQGTTMTAEVVTPPQHGQLVLQADGSFRYTPEANYHGSDSFSYRAINAAGDATEGTASILVETVNDVPNAGDDSFTVAAGGTLQTTAATGVMANDTDIDSPALTANLLQGPAHGTLQFNADGSFTYTPTAGYTGADEFIYQLNDGISNSQVAHASIAVTPAIEAQNSRPAVHNDHYVLQGDAPSTITAEEGVLINDHDAQGDAMLASLFGGPQHGSVVLNGDGSFTYTPQSGYVGTDSFLYWVNDGHLQSALAAVTLVIESPAEDQPPQLVVGDVDHSHDLPAFDCVLTDQSWM